MKNLLCVLVFGSIVLFLAAPNSVAQTIELSFDRGKVFDEVWMLAKEHFFDPAAVRESWDRAAEQFRPRALTAETHADFAGVMNELLLTLNTSHTAYFAAPCQRRNQILGVFETLAPKNRDDLFCYDSIGVEVERDSDRTFVRAVYDGFPGSKAGLRFGDEIVSVDNKPFQEIDSFRGKKEVQLMWRRTAQEDPQSLQVPVTTLDGRTMFEIAMSASATLLEREQRRIGYVHVWSYAGSKYQELLRELLLFGKLREADALILDLRDGWGGASLEYLNLFRESIAEVTSRPRDGEPFNFNGVWNKPVVLLVNQRSTSGKELFAYGFRKLGLGEIVGETTAGAVVAGRCFLLSNEDVLYLAVSDVAIDGQRLEGKGIEPTVRVDRPLPFAAGADPPLERAIELLSNR